MPSSGSRCSGTTRRRRRRRCRLASAAAARPAGRRSAPPPRTLPPPSPSPPWGSRWHSLDAWPFAVLYALWALCAARLLWADGWAGWYWVQLGTYALVALHVSVEGWMRVWGLLVGVGV